MKKIVTLENIKEVFCTQVNDALIGIKALSIDLAVQQVINFFEKYSVANVDNSISESDYLSFDYGSFSWTNTTDKNFIAFITRRLTPVGNEYNFRYDLVISLHFKKIMPRTPTALRIDSNNFETLDKWTAEVKNSAGYKAIKKLDPITVEVEMIKHKYGW